MKQLVNDRYDREIVEYTCTQVLVAIPNVHFFIDIFYLIVVIVCMLRKAMLRIIRACML